jgi:hypothetical protein
MARNATQLFRVAAKGTVEEVRKTLIATAKREHARIMQTEPRPKRFIRAVDGVAGAREEQVKPGGVIRYRYQRLEEVVRAAMELLFELSPVLSGEYRLAHTLFVDGAAASDLSAWDGTGTIVITNMMPYARVIEAGKMKMRVPGSDHVYEQAEILLRREYGNTANIKFNYRGVVGGSMPNPLDDAPLLKRPRSAKGRFVKSGAARTYNNRSLRYPALEISERGR